MVRKLKVKVTREQMEVAAAHGIARNTVYARLKSGWDMERAITEPPRALPSLSRLSRNEEGSIVARKPKGKIRSISLDRDLDALADRAIAQSGLTMGDWFSEAVRQHLRQF